MADTSKYVYQFGDYFNYSSDQELTENQVEDLYQRLDNVGTFDKRIKDAQDLHRTDLVANQAFLDTYRDFYKAHKKKDFEGTDEELVDDYYSQMRWWDFNLPALGALTFQLQGGHYDEKSKQNLAIMFDTWDKVVPFYKENGKQWAGFFKDFAISNLTDVTNLINLGGIAGAGARASASKATQEGLKFHLKNSVIRGALGSAVEGAAMTYADDQLRQNIEKQILGREETDWGRSMLATTVGATLGGALGAIGTKGGKDFADKTTSDLVDHGHKVPMLAKIAELYKKAGEEHLPVDQKNAVDYVEGLYNKHKDLIDAYEAFEKGIVETGTETGEARRLLREQHKDFLYEQIGKHIDARRTDRGIEPAFVFETPEGTFGFNEITSKEVTMNFLEKTMTKKELREGDVFDIARALIDKGDATAKKLNKAPIQAIGAKVKKVRTREVDGDNQYMALLVGSLNSTYDQLQRVVLADIPTERLKFMHDTFLDLIDKVSVKSSSAGGQLELAKYIAKDLKALDTKALHDLTPIEKVAFFNTMVGERDLKSALKFSEDVSKFLKMGLVKGVRNSFEWLKQLALYNILGGVSSTSMNFLSGTALGLFRIPQKFIAGSLMEGAYAKAWRQASMEEIRHLVDKGVWMDSLNLTWKAFLKSQGQLDTRHIYDEASDAFLKDIDLSKGVIEGVKGSFGEYGKAKGSRALFENAVKFIGGRAMITSDEMIANQAFRRSAYFHAFLEEIQKGVSREEAVAIATERTQRAITEQLENAVNGKVSYNPLVKKALETAREVKAQRELERGFDVGQIGRWAQQATHHLPKRGTATEQVVSSVGGFFGTLVVPFTRTPASLLNYTFEMTPGLAMLSKKFRRDIFSGDAERVAMAEAKLILGTGLWGAALTAALNMDIEGIGSLDYQQRETQKGTGKGTRYTFTKGTPIVGGMSFDRMEPFNVPLKVFADMQDILRYGTEEDAKKAYTALSLHLAGMLTDYPAFQGTERLIKIASLSMSDMDLDKKTSRVGAEGGKYFGTLIPFFRVLSEFYGEEQMHEVDGFLGAIKQNIPFFRGTGNLRRDPIFGKPLQRDGYMFGVPLLPKVTNNDPDGIVNETIRNLSMTIHDPSPMWSVAGNENARLDYRDYEWENGADYYDKYQDLIGTITIRGKNLEQTMKEYVESDSFKTMAYDRKFHGIVGEKQEITSNIREQTLEKIIRNFRSYAREILLEESIKKAHQGNEDAQRFIQDMNTIKTESFSLLKAQ